MSGIWGANAIRPGRCLDYLPPGMQVEEGNLKKNPHTCRYDSKLVPPALQHFCPEPWALTYPANVNSDLDCSPI
jgi:hypothetical protein